jgi:hypothetical protein
MIRRSRKPKKENRGRNSRREKERLTKQKKNISAGKEQN